jgi:hypothetical protein
MGIRYSIAKKTENCSRSFRIIVKYVGRKIGLGEMGAEVLVLQKGASC